MAVEIAKSKIHFNFKTSILIGLFWIVATLLVQIVYLDASEALLPQLLTTFLGVGLVAFPLYFTLQRFIPKLLYKKKIWKFIGAITLAAFLNSLFSNLVGNLIYALATNQELFEKETIFYRIYIFTIIYTVNFTLIILGSAIKIIHDRYKMEDELRLTYDQRKESELAFLRAQINPHFFFNILNTIYFQITPDNLPARHTIETLSEMMRYQLYECDTDLLAIEKEIKYFENYIALQGLRMEKGVRINFSADKEMNNIRIPPFLIMPLIENAFKHISHHAVPEENLIDVTIGLADDKSTIIAIFNTCDSVSSNHFSKKNGGVGIQNLQRRLQLIYPERHELKCIKTNNEYLATLKLSIP